MTEVALSAGRSGRRGCFPQPYGHPVPTSHTERRPRFSLPGVSWVTRTPTLPWINGRQAWGPHSTWPGRRASRVLVHCSQVAGESGLLPAQDAAPPPLPLRLHGPDAMVVSPRTPVPSLSHRLMPPWPRSPQGLFRSFCWRLLAPSRLQNAGVRARPPAFCRVPHTGPGGLLPTHGVLFPPPRAAHPSQADVGF